MTLVLKILNIRFQKVYSTDILHIFLSELSLLALSILPLLGRTVALYFISNLDLRLFSASISYEAIRQLVSIYQTMSIRNESADRFHR